MAVSAARSPLTTSGANRSTRVGADGWSRLNSQSGRGATGASSVTSYRPAGVVLPAATMYPPHARVSINGPSLPAVLVSLAPVGAVKYRCCPLLAVRVR